jgi:FixJ family two-component response regulator
MVIVIEDDPATQKALGRMLRAGGFQTLMYGSAEEFLESPPPGLPTCLLVDVHLGAMSGLDLQRRLKADGSRLPIIVMTAFDDARVRAEAHRNGCFGYVPKESDGEVLLALLRSLPGR